jgi:hypothetical protein
VATVTSPFVASPQIPAADSHVERAQDLAFDKIDAHDAWLFLELGDDDMVADLEHLPRLGDPTD